MPDLYHTTTLGLAIMDAFADVAPRYGLRLVGIEDDANEHSLFWQDVAAAIVPPRTPPTTEPDRT